MSGWYLVHGIKKARVWECYSLEMRARGEPVLRSVPWPDMRKGPGVFHVFQSLADWVVNWPFRRDLSIEEMAKPQPNWRRLSPKIDLSYRFTDPATRESRRVTVSIPVVPDSRGRPWFLCPRCERRCGKLYLPAWGWKFWCRLCHGLHYRMALSSDPIVQVVEIWELAVSMRAYGLDGVSYYAGKMKLIIPELYAALRGQKLSKRQTLQLGEERQRAKAVGVLSEWLRAQVEGRKFVFPKRPARLRCGEAQRLRRSLRMKCGRLGGDEALCLRCHTKRKMIDAQPFTMKSGRRALRAKCASCGARVIRIIRSEERGEKQ